MPPDPPAMLTLEDVRFGFPERPDFLGPVAVTVQRGECWAVVGPNGAGKSTLLKLMAGLHPPHVGEVRLGGGLIGKLSIRQRARQVAFVPQHVPVDVDMSVQDVVLMGRFPHRSLSLFESPEDREIARRAMEVTATSGLVKRSLATLSGGETQRVHIAAAITQQPELMLLDEPTASLDLQHQLAIFRILRDRAWYDGLAVVVVTHDVNLAARFCSHVLLLDEGQVASMGAPADVVTPDVLAPVYGVELATLGGADYRWIVPADDPSGGRR
ncbi:MAG: ABC transporter ATP-binding protein [Phycisphaerales bacterium]|nr:MAG: ABC transporter ATP-binding protein [Phycisphaerales bacterium]